MNVEFHSVLTAQSCSGDVTQPVKITFQISNNQL